MKTIWTEAEIARERRVDYMAAEATLIRSAVIDVIAGGNLLGDMIEAMRDE